jgi:sugar transferase (PEP-CTERM system associated)
LKESGLSYIRLNKHYIHLPYLYLGVVDALIVAGVAWSIQHVGFSTDNLDPSSPISYQWLPIITLSLVLSCCTLSMGVYTALIREGFSSMVLRTMVSFFLLGSLSLYFINLVFDGSFIDQSLIFWSVLLSTLMVCVSRWFFVKIVDVDQLKRRVVVYGAGSRADKLLADLAPDVNVLGVHIVGCIPSADEPVMVDPALTIQEPSDWLSFVKQFQISEIVIAPDERRRSSGDVFPLSQFLDCKLAGISSSDALSFCERELGKIDISLLQPGWMLFSDGFKYSKRRLLAKRLFDLALASGFLLLLWPFMLLTALAVKLESPGAVLYHQIRVGLNGRPFRIYKFRSMRQDAEKNGAVWAQKNDARVTRVGAFIRNTRLDELPQLYNVFAGHMSFVGPRPERPEFVIELAQQIPFYEMRHKVKPGLMGWAQLKYPYGASVEDAKNKLQYDLYYTKNHSFFMDMLIMIQTVEIILLGKGVH